MSEITKLYENVGVKKVRQTNIAGGDYPIAVGFEDYPPFTAEKQLEIVKFMLHKGIYYDTDGDTYWFHYADEIENATYRPFEEAITEFINGFWQFLTEKERKQIKNILESEVRE